MEGEPCDVVPCSSVTVDSILRIGTAGAIWGLCAGPHDARKKGEVGWNVWSSVCIGLKDLLLEFVLLLTAGFNDIGERAIGLVNGVVAGAVAGGAIAAMTRSWTQVIPMACLVSAFKVATDYARAV
ncbi:outer envelope pore protein 16-4, chloroplastic isoform X4 [Malus domestica]|uniref:outer envelope pore protein 16-4, chloroplastic isoform X4 n=1 Tax=Malus domestica TaxID=3750 RepID=UPI003975CAFB